MKLDFHNIGNMKNSKSKLQKNATFSSSMERALCKSVFAKECNFFRQHGKNPMQVQIVKIIRKSAEKNIGAELPGLGYEKRRCLDGNGPCCDYAVGPEPRWRHT